MTEYFFWPRKDAWEELKAALDARSWIGEREKVGAGSAGCVRGAGPGVWGCGSSCLSVFLSLFKAGWGVGVGGCARGTRIPGVSTLRLAWPSASGPAPTCQPSPPSAGAAAEPVHRGDQLLAGREQAQPGPGAREVPQLQVLRLLSAHSVRRRVMPATARRHRARAPRRPNTGRHCGLCAQGVPATTPSLLLSLLFPSPPLPSPCVSLPC